MSKSETNIYEKAGFELLLEKLPAGIVVFNQNYQVEYNNGVFGQMCILYGFEEIPAEGQLLPKSDFVKRCGVTEEISLLVEGHPFEKTIKRINTLDGSKINVLLKGVPFFKEGIFTGGMIILEDFRVSEKEEKGKTLTSVEYAAVFNSYNDLFLVTDCEGTVLYSGGKQFENLFKKNLAAADNIVYKLFPTSSEELKRAISRGLENTFSAKYFFNDLEYIFKCTVETVIRQRKNNNLVFLLFTDITNAHVAELNKDKELRELKRYQIITEAATDAVFAINASGEITFWNKASENLFGFSRSQVFGKFFGKVLSFFDYEYFESVKKELKRDLIWKSRFNVINKNREKEIVKASFTQLKDEEQTIIVLCSNETERHNVEKQLRHSEEKYRNIVTQANEFICSISLDNFIQYVNPVFLETLGYNEEELINSDFQKLVDKSEMDPQLLNFSTDQTKFNIIEVPVLKKNGERLYLLAKFSPVVNDDGQARYYNGFLTDITAAKETEKELRIFKLLFETSKDGIAVESEGVINYANNALGELFGYQTGLPLQGKNFTDLVYHDDIPAITRHLNSLDENIPSSVSFEFTLKREDRLKYFVDVSASSFKSGNTALKVFSMRDTTERKRSRQALRDSEQRYRNLTENIDDFIYKLERVGKSTRPVFYTASVEKITGFSQTEFLTDSKLFFKIIHPDDFVFVKRKIRVLLRNRIQLSEEFEFRIIHKYGNSVWVRNKANILRAPNGEVETIYGLISDITLRKKAEEELENTTQNLVKLNETKDRFISIISHDLRTPFSSILGFTDLLLNDDELSNDEKNQYVRFIQDSSKSMLSLVNSLLDWTRLQTGRINFEPERLNAAALINSSMQALTGAAMQKNIELTNLV
ncbi:MAG: PAS domain-containing sensor histidine kinase, partial [Ignavibacteriaceae bacterium]|nr:PAS domain-containing sensor histidine kinase [Ignavibacteriaceae bacterium]